MNIKQTFFVWFSDPHSKSRPFDNQVIQILFLRVIIFRRCESFFYGGCGGNGNNFHTLKECHEACRGHLAQPDDVSLHLRSAHCLLPPVSQTLLSCMAFFQRFTFNSKSLECEPYIYGGCGATANLYLSKEECKASCIYGDLKLGKKFSFFYYPKSYLKTYYLQTRAHL